MKKIFRIQATAMTIAAAAVLAACGGGGGSDNVAPPPNPITLGGTAAVGFPIVGAVVKVTCASGAALTSQPTSNVGAWQVALSGHTFPCAAQVSGGTINRITNTTVYHALGLTSGILNITPLTDLVVANAAQSATPSAWFTALNSGTFAQINATAVTNAVNLLIRILGLAQLGTSINPMTSSFTPAAGNVMDDTLTALSTALTIAAITYPTLLAQAGAGPAFSAPAGFSARLGSAYVGTTSGKATAGAGTGTSGTGTAASGKAANGTPALTLANCTSKVAVNQYMKCAANAVANFSAVSMDDATDGQVCTASYSNGALTVTKGALTISTLINGNALSMVGTLGSGASETLDTLSGFSSVGLNITTTSVTWNAAGVLKRIKGDFTILTGGGQQLSCTQP